MADYEYQIPTLPKKIRLYLAAFIQVPFYRYGEIGNICYTIGKNILDGAILYTMFFMAENELKVAAILGVMVKYAYPGITLISSNLISGFIDRLESLKETKEKATKLIYAYMGIGIGQSLGAIFLLLCFPPVFKYLFADVSFKAPLIVVFYFLHHVCDGSAQIVEGRTWFKIIEISLRNGMDKGFSRNFWVIYAVSQNFQLVMGQVFLWSALAITADFGTNPVPLVVNAVVYSGVLLVLVSKFILPVAYKLRRCPCNGEKGLTC